MRCKRGYRGFQRTAHNTRFSICLLPLIPLTPQHPNRDALGPARHPWPVRRNGKLSLAAMIEDGTSALPASASRDLYAEFIVVGPLT